VAAKLESTTRVPSVQRAAADQWGRGTFLNTYRIMCLAPQPEASLGIPFHFTLDQNIKRDPFKSEDLESKTYSVHVKPGGALQIPLNGTSSRFSWYASRLRFSTVEVRNGK
jgi:hypothetical protein